MTFQNEHTWDVSPDIGFLTFASPEDAKKAEDLFNRIQQEAKAVVKDAERYRWLLRNYDLAVGEPMSLPLDEAVIDAAMSEHPGLIPIP